MTLGQAVLLYVACGVAMLVAALREEGGTPIEPVLASLASIGFVILWPFYLAWAFFLVLERRRRNGRK